MKTFMLIAALLATWLQADDIDALMQRLKQDLSADSKLLQAREQAFLEKKADQAKLLGEAKAKLKAAQKLAKMLQQSYETNEATIAKRQTTLEAKTGNLGEIFGVVRQSAGDMAGIVRASLVSAEYPGRTQFLDAMAGSKKIPNAEQLEKLWLETLNEAAEAGKCVTFKADIVTPEGTTKPAEVTRIGLFTAIAEGKFLRLDSNGKLVELPRQPEARYLTLASAVQSTHSGIVTAPIDPTRGAILELMMEKPTLTERIHQGGLVGYVILALGAAGLLIALGKLATLLRTASKVRRQAAAADTPKADNPLGRVLNVYNAGQNESVEIVESRLDEAILKELPGITFGEQAIKLIAAIAPLLGLLGTVVGMIETFQSITLFGTGDPKLMAGGISQALVTTMLGLMVAIPLLFAHSIVRSRSRAIIEILSQQSAGLIARRMEKA